jgi:hypothetical protein
MSKCVLRAVLCCVQAIDDCGKAIALDSGYVKAYKKRAESLYSLGKMIYCK